MPQPETLGRNGSYAAFRKLHQDVAAFRRYLSQAATSPEDEELLAAKMMGRWRSGAPLALSPQHDDPALGADPGRRNTFLYAREDPAGFVTPAGCHIRRANPRDASVAGEVRLHRMIRRGAVYGSPLPDGGLENDGVDRGLMFAFIGAHLGRQFEFVQSQWMNDSVFFGAGDAKDPVAGSHDGSGGFTVPRRPVRRRLPPLPRFVVTRGGEYCFLPGLRALRWLGDLRDHRAAGTPHHHGRHRRRTQRPARPGRDRHRLLRPARHPRRTRRGLLSGLAAALPIAAVLNSRRNRPPTTRRAR
ncbi:Dyp-type peroxidase [Streptomyces sp. NPDC001282]|uniref:Dyp-type peroxidase n=1 Tax=Streptomyces sp. NPDC001282 TaxID=3364557 RepID=UPI0036D1289F